MRCRIEEFLVGIVGDELIVYTVLGAYNKLFLTTILCIINDLCRTADKIGDIKKLRLTFGVNENRCCRMLVLYLLKLLDGDRRVDRTATVIDDYILFGNLLCYVSTEIAVGNKEYIFIGE